MSISDILLNREKMYNSSTNEINKLLKEQQKQQQNIESLQINNETSKSFLQILNNELKNNEKKYKVNKNNLINNIHSILNDLNNFENIYKQKQNIQINNKDIILENEYESYISNIHSERIRLQKLLNELNSK